MVLWDPQTCDYQLRLRGHDEMVVDAVFSPDGERLVTGSFDSMAALWNTGNDEIEARYETDVFAVESVAWQPGGDSLALGLGGRAQVILWNPLTQEQEAIIGAPDAYGWVRSLAWSPDGTWLAAGIAREVIVWNAATHQHTTLTAIGGFGEVWGLAWTPDGATLITGSTDGTLMLWDARAFGLELR
jgi:WD40 repeat protein